MSDDNVIQFPKPKKDQVESCEIPVIGISSYRVEEFDLKGDELLAVLNDLFGKSAIDLELEDLFWQIKQGIKLNPESAEYVIQNLKRLANSFEKN